jgi:NAD-dependent SIR2 family protein deacetylase
MGYDFERSMGDLVDVVRRAKEQDGAVILLGAGCSKTAGIPLAGDFRAIIEERSPSTTRGRHAAKEQATSN